jgi:hypothetical protein
MQKSKFSWYRQKQIEYCPWDWTYTVHFGAYLSDCKTYLTLSKAKRAIDKYLKDCGE